MNSYLIVQGQVAAQAALSPMRNLITRAIGSQATVEADIQCHRPQPNDIYLLASDGLTHEVIRPGHHGSLGDADTDLWDAAGQ